MDNTLSRHQIAAVHLHPGVRTLDRAEGVLIALRHCTSEDAFDELLEAACSQHLPVFTVAAALVELASNVSPSTEDPAARAAAESQWGNLIARHRPTR